MRRLRVLAAVVVTTLTVAAGLPVTGVAAADAAEAVGETTSEETEQGEAHDGQATQNDGAQAQSSVSLAASNITGTTATLTITGHSTAWYWSGGGPLALCSAAVPSGIATYILGGLTPATSYTFKAYSDSACATEVTSDSTDADFTTPGLVLSDYDVAVTEGSLATYTVRLAAKPASDVTVTVARATDRYPSLSIDTDPRTPGNQSTLTFTPQNYSTAQTVTVSVAADSAHYSAHQITSPLTSIVHSAASSDVGYSGASDANAVRIVDSTAPMLSASSVTATGATLTITNRTTAWHHRGLATPGTWGTCTAVGANTSSVTLSSLTPGTEYTYYAYDDSSCTGELAFAHTGVQFTTPGVTLSTRKLIAPEGSTAAYGVRLATKPAGSVTVTVTKASGGDSDLTVDTDPSTTGDQDTLAFTAANWDTPQTVTVAAAEEAGATDKAYGTATFNHSATAGYTTTATSALTVTEGDNDVCPGTTAVGGATVTVGGLVNDCNTLLAAKATLAGTSTAIDNWATTLDMASWTGIYKTANGVTHIALTGEGLSGSVPNTLGDLTGPTTVSLNVNSLSGPIPAELGNLTSLTILSLAVNSLSGPIPAQLGNLTSLTALSLYSNLLSGPIPAQLGNLTSLNMLYLQNNWLSGRIPAELGNLTKLTYLFLDANALSGPIPPSLGNIGTKNAAPLWGLSLTGNALSGPIPWQLGRSDPVSLDFDLNALSGTIPEALANTMSLRWLRLSGNSLSGTLPRQLGSLSGLQTLYLRENAFSGPIPAQLGSLTQLTQLHLWDNDLSGPIPASLGDLELLDTLNLHRNSLTGAIPASLGDLAALQRLRLNHNDLSGAIPSKLGSLSNLNELVLLGNHLSGAMPAELGSLTALKALYFNDNRLSGCVPAGLLGFLSDNFTDVQSDGTTLAVCDGLVLSDAPPSVGEDSTATYTVRLSTAPTADVTVAVAASGDSDITVSPASLTFTTIDWSTPQTVTLTAAADTDAADGTATVTHTATSIDSRYDQLTAAATATEDDDDPSLSALPLPDRARLEISDHSSAWYHKQTAPTPGTCSAQVFAGRSHAEVTSLKPSTSYTYKAYSDSTCTAANELASATFTTASGVLPLTRVVMAPEGTTADSAEHASFAVVLATAPTANVTVTVSGDTNGDSDLTFDTDKVTAGAQDTLTFTSQNWNMPKFVSVYAAEDSDTADGTKQLTLSSASTDSVYSGATATVEAIELDDDGMLTAAAVTATSAVLTFANHRGDWYLKSGNACTPQGNDHTVRLTGLTPTTQHKYKAYSDAACLSELTSDATDAEFTTENLAVLTPETLSVAEGSSAAYTVALATHPTANVTLALAVTGDSDVTVSPASLTFTSQNWSTGRRVTVRAAQDADGAHGTAAITHVASSTDAAYAGRNIGAVPVTEADDDVGLNASDVTATTATLTLSNHTSAWYYQRTAPTVGSCIGAVPAGTATASLENLTPGLSYTFKAYSDSACSTSLTGDAYDADFVTPLATLSAQDVPVPEGDTAAYTIALAAAPTSDVTVTLAVTGDSDVTVSPVTLTFTSTTYSRPQTVTVSAAHDGDTTAGTATITHTTTSNDTTFSGKSLGTVTVTEADDDPTLTAESVGSSAATLRIANHTGAWHYKQTTPAGGTCSDEIARGITAARLSGLSPSTSYVFKAYSDPGCATELTDDTSDARFTTPSASTSTPGGGTPGGGGGGGGSGRAASIRLSGADRYATAAAVGNKFVALVEDASAAGGTRQQVDTVIVASGEAFPDALAASALARTLRAPVLLTPKKQLDPAVKSFVTRNRITKVVIVGGPAAVSDDVADALRGLPGIDSVTRHAGADRYATAALIAQAAGAPGNLCGSTTPTVIVTTGQNYPDALVAGPLAYRGRHPIVLTAADRLPEATAEYLRTSGAKQAVIVGGPAAVSAVIDAIKALGLETSRVSGADRADTSVQFARRFSAFSGPSCYRRDTVGLATGFAFPDALAAASLLGHYGAPLLLTSPKGVPQPLLDYAAAGRLTPDFDQPPIVTIGGRNAVPSNHPTKLLAALPR